MLGSVTSAVQYVVGGQILPLNVLYTTVTNAALSYFRATFFTLSDTNPSGL